MITRLRSRFPATCSRSAGVEGEYILSGEALSVEALQRGRSRVSYLEGSSDGRGGFKDGEGARRNAFTIGLRGGSMRARTHLKIRGTAVLYGGAVSGRHNPNSKPVPAPWVNNNILLHPALPSIRLSDQMHEPLPSGVTRINPRCQVPGRWLRYFFQGFMALSRWSEAPPTPTRA